MSDKLTLNDLWIVGETDAPGDMLIGVLIRQPTLNELLEALGAKPIRWCETHDCPWPLNATYCKALRRASYPANHDTCVEGRPRYDIPEAT